MSGSAQFPFTTVSGPPVERRELFRGRSSHLTEVSSYTLGGALGIAGIGAAVAGLVASIGVLSPAGLLLALAGGAVALRAWVRVVSVRYRVDTLRVEVERGILRTRIDNLELWRVKDLQFRQSVVQRLLKTGDVVLLTSDSTSPTLVIRGVRGARELYDRLRDAVDQARRWRGVLGIETTD